MAGRETEKTKIETAEEFAELLSKTGGKAFSFVQGNACFRSAIKKKGEK